MIAIKEMIKPFIVREVINLTDASYILRFSKNNMNFKAGQHLVVGLMNTKDSREYSIYSGSNDEYLEILVREVEKGDVSRKLRRLTKGDTVEINGPYGFFMYNAHPRNLKNSFSLQAGQG